MFCKPRPEVHSYGKTYYANTIKGYFITEKGIILNKYSYGDDAQFIPRKNIISAKISCVDIYITKISIGVCEDGDNGKRIYSNIEICDKSPGDLWLFDFFLELRKHIL